MEIWLFLHSPFSRVVQPRLFLRPQWHKLAMNRHRKGDLAPGRWIQHQEDGYDAFSHHFLSLTHPSRPRPQLFPSTFALISKSRNSGNVFPSRAASALGFSAALDTFLELQFSTTEVTKLEIQFYEMRFVGHGDLSWGKTGTKCAACADIFPGLFIILCLEG